SCVSLIFFLQFSRHHRDLHSFPTRRSSDLTCVEGTARCGAELGYHVTLVRDATAAFSSDAMRAAHDINGPTFAHAILLTDEVIRSEEHTSELQSPCNLVCRLLLEKKKKNRS